MKKTIRYFAVLMCLVGLMSACGKDDKETSSPEARGYASAAVGTYNGYVDLEYTFNDQHESQHFEREGIVVSNPQDAQIAITIYDINGKTVIVKGWFDGNGNIEPEDIHLEDQSFGATISHSTLRYDKTTEELSGDVNMLMKDLNENVTANAVATIYGKKQ